VGSHRGDEPSTQRSLFGHEAPALPSCEAQRENLGSPVDGEVLFLAVSWSLPVGRARPSGHLPHRGHQL